MKGFSERFVKKYMRIAREIGTYDNPCHSRKIGAVIVHPGSNRILGTGYNGPAPGTPHPTSAEYLSEYFWPQLTDADIASFRAELGLFNADDDVVKDAFIRKYTGRAICPRRLVGAKSGERSELCSCGHAERHAITNAAQDLHGSSMFCWCGVPCLQCSDSIVQAGIEEVYCLRGPLYHKQSPWLLEKGGVAIYEYDAADF